MFPVFSLIIAVLAAMIARGLTEDAYPFAYPEGRSLLFTAGLVLVPILVGQLEYLRVRRLLGRAETTWETLTRAYGRARARLHVVVVAAYLVALFGAHWSEFLTRLGIKDWFLLDELLEILPFFLGAMGSWVQEYRIAALVQVPTDSLHASVAFRMRLTLIPILPLGLVAAGKDLLVLAGLEGHFLSFDYLGWGALAGFVLLLFTIAPFMVRFVLGTESLPPGPLRDALENLGTKVGFRCRDILVWNTNGRFLNAAVVGLSPSLRYVLLTDLLLRRLPENEILAVYSHEAAHGVNRHAPLYMLLSLLFIFLAFPLAAAFPVESIVAAGFIALAIFFVYWFLFFGFVSRRVEREADLFGATSVGDVDWMIGALERIAFLSGERKRFSAWRHFSIERRVETLERLREEPSLLHRVRRTRRRIALGSVLALLVAGAAAVRDFPLQHARGKVQFAFYEGNLGKLQESAAEAMRRYPDDPWFVYMKGVGAVGRMLPEEARELFSRALEMAPEADLEAAIQAELRELEE